MDSFQSRKHFGDPAVVEFEKYCRDQSITDPIRMGIENRNLPEGNYLDYHRSLPIAERLKPDYYLTDWRAYVDCKRSESTMGALVERDAYMSYQRLITDDERMFLVVFRDRILWRWDLHYTTIDLDPAISPGDLWRTSEVDEFGRWFSFKRAGFNSYNGSGNDFGILKPQKVEPIILKRL